MPYSPRSDEGALANENRPKQRKSRPKRREIKWNAARQEVCPDGIQSRRPLRQVHVARRGKDEYFVGRGRMRVRGKTIEQNRPKTTDSAENRVQRGTRRNVHDAAPADQARACRRIEGDAASKNIAHADARARGAHTELDAERAAENDRNGEIVSLPDPISARRGARRSSSRVQARRG